jgi:hypothetical protein
MEHSNVLPDDIADEMAEVIRAINYKGMPFTRYCEIFEQPRGSANDAKRRGDIEVFKVGGRVWVTGRSIAERHRLEHLLVNENGGAKTEAVAPPVITKEQRDNRRSG